MRKGVLLLLGMFFIGLLIYQTALRPVKIKEDTHIIREGVLNDVAINDSVERVISNFGTEYNQDEQIIQFESNLKAETYLVYLYKDARIYVKGRLVKAVELITSTYASPRGPQVGSTREEVEQWYGRPEGSTGNESQYVYYFNIHLAFKFNEENQVSSILLY